MSQIPTNRFVLLILTLFAAGLARSGSETASAPVPADAQELARQIMADPSLPLVLSRARDLLRTGFNAGSGYGEVWIRDLNTFIELTLYPV